MKYLKYIVLIIMINSCKNPDSQSKMDISTYLTDRTWVTENKSQYYYSSLDNKEYLWMTVERSGEIGDLSKTSTPFSKAKGTPFDNPYNIDKEIYSNYNEGWSESSHFKIKGNQLLLQYPEDIKAENLNIYQLRVGKDTTIGLFEFNTLLVANEYGERIWLAEKSNK